MKPRLFIIEGPDCSGKSTLARHIAVQKDAVYIHASGAKSLHQAMQEYHESLFAIAAQNLEMGRNVVMDRFWPSEVVYGQALRPGLHERIYDADKFQILLSARDVSYVFCNDPEVETRHAAQQDPDHPYDPDQFAKIVKAYDALTKEMMESVEPHFHVRQYDVTVYGDQMGTFVDSL
jgi:thymidylate kinase